MSQGRRHGTVFDLTVTYNGHLGTLVRTLCFPTPSTWKWPRTLIKYPGIVTLRCAMIDDMSTCLDGLVNLRRLFLHGPYISAPAALFHCNGPAAARLQQLHINRLDDLATFYLLEFVTAIPALVELQRLSATSLSANVCQTWMHEILLPQLMASRSLRCVRFLLLCFVDENTGSLRRNRSVEFAGQDPRITLAVSDNVTGSHQLDLLHVRGRLSLWDISTLLAAEPRSS